MQATTPTQPTILAVCAATTAPTVQSCNYRCKAAGMDFTYAGTYQALLAYLASACYDFTSRTRLTWQVSNISTGTRFTATFGYRKEENEWYLRGTDYPA